MEWALSLALGLLMAGCAGYPQRFRSERAGVRFIFSDAQRIHDHGVKAGCRKNDRGEPITGRIRACYTPPGWIGKVFRRRGTIWLSDWSSVVHELCHVDGRPREECDGIHARE